MGTRSKPVVAAAQPQRRGEQPNGSNCRGSIHELRHGRETTGRAKHLNMMGLPFGADLRRDS